MSKPLTHLHGILLDYMYKGLAGSARRLHGLEPEKGRSVWRQLARLETNESEVASSYRYHCRDQRIILWSDNHAILFYYFWVKFLHCIYPHIEWND